VGYVEVVNDMKLLFENWRRYLDEGEAGQQQIAQDLQDPEFYKYRDPSVWLKELPRDGFEPEEGKGGVFDLGRTLKKVFAKNADREFIDSLVTMHYARDMEGALKLLSGARSRDEISCTAYLPNQPRFDMKSSWGAGIAIEVKGHITVLAASMGDLVTGTISHLRPHLGTPRTRDSGLNKGIASNSWQRSKFLDPETTIAGNLILDKEDFIGRGANAEAWGINEALVDNWKPVGMYVIRNWGAAGPDCEDERNKIIRKIEILKRRGKLPKEFVVKFKEACP
jgi:hypothetical protein